MDKQTLENIFIFAITYCNTHNGNKGDVHPTYLDEKSRKYLGFNISECEDISIEDFGEDISSKTGIPEGLSESERVSYTHYHPLLPHQIINRIKDKLDISKISNYPNVYRSIVDKTGYRDIDIVGLDHINTQVFISIFEDLDDDYIKTTLREVNSSILLEE